MHIRKATENSHLDPSEATYLAAAAALGLHIPAKAAAGIAQNWALLAHHYQNVVDTLKSEAAA
jgi:hypothetical protein